MRSTPMIENYTFLFTPKNLAFHIQCKEKGKCTSLDFFIISGLMTMTVIPISLPYLTVTGRGYRLQYRQFSRGVVKASKRLLL